MRIDAAIDELNGLAYPQYLFGVDQSTGCPYAWRLQNEHAGEPVSDARLGQPEVGAHSVSDYSKPKASTQRHPGKTLSPSFYVARVMGEVLPQ